MRKAPSLTSNLGTWRSTSTQRKKSGPSSRIWSRWCSQPLILRRSPRSMSMALMCSSLCKPSWNSPYSSKPNQRNLKSLKQLRWCHSIPTKKKKLCQKLSNQSRKSRRSNKYSSILERCSMSSRPKSAKTSNWRQSWRKRRTMSPWSRWSAQQRISSQAWTSTKTQHSASKCKRWKRVSML